MTNNQIFATVAIVSVLIVAGVWYFSGKSSDPQPSNSNTEATQTTNSNENTNQPNEVADKVDTKCQRNFNQQTMDSTKADLSNNYVTLSVENFGDIKIELYKDKAPKTSENFLKLVQAGFYDCLTFHRILDGFVIQGGDPEGTGLGGPGYTVPAEIGIAHTKGVIAMARQSDQMNPTRASSGSQFYIALEDLPSLDAGGYTVFGKVVSGMDIVDKIGLVEVAPNGSGMPLTPVIITKAVASKE